MILDCKKAIGLNACALSKDQVSGVYKYPPLGAPDGQCFTPFIHPLLAIVFPPIPCASHRSSCWNALLYYRPPGGFKMMDWVSMVKHLQASWATYPWYHHKRTNSLYTPTSRVGICQHGDAFVEVSSSIAHFSSRVSACREQARRSRRIFSRCGPSKHAHVRRQSHFLYFVFSFFLTGELFSWKC